MTGLGRSLYLFSARCQRNALEFLVFLSRDLNVLACFIIINWKHRNSCILRTQISRVSTRYTINIWNWKERVYRAPGSRSQRKEIKSHKMRSACQRSYTHIFCILDSYYVYVAAGGTLNSFLYEVPLSHYGILEIPGILCWIRSDGLLKRAMSIWPTNALNWVSSVALCKRHFSSAVNFREFPRCLFRV